jgi:tetratricopeptide (TPR) repeat protein
VGIFKKILQKKEKGTESPSTKHSTPKKKNAPERADPLAPLGGEDEVRSPPISSPAQDLVRDPAPGEETHRNHLDPAPMNTFTDSTRSWERPSKEGGGVGTVSPQRADETLSPVPRRVREAERALADMERSLAETASLFQGTEALPRLKILLVEAKIRLAEADIKLSESEIAPAGSPTVTSEIESRISMAETKIGEAEKMLSSLSVPVSAKGSLSRLKIGIAGMKIRLAEIQIALAGSSLEGSSGTGIASPDRANAAISRPMPDLNVPSDTNPIHMRIENEVQGVRQPDLPKEVKIHDDLQTGEPLPEIHNEPVRIREEESDTRSGPAPAPSEQGERIVLPDMENDSSPFETGINLNRVRIRNEDASDTADPQATSQERVKIRSDERESAWVTEDGSLKIVSREKNGSEQSHEEEKPRISIQQPEVEKVLIIEELNRKGIEQRKKGEIEEALRSFERVLEIDPVNEAALHNKGVALRSAGRYEEALACFDRAQERDPNNPVILFNRGFCLGKLERFEESLKAFDRVLALNPEHASGWFNKGKILQKMGRMEEAEEHLKKARELGYH